MSVETVSKTPVETLGKTLGKMPVKSSVKSSVKITALMMADPAITIPRIAKRLRVTPRAIEKRINRLKADGTIRRIGPDKGGHWEVVR